MKENIEEEKAIKYYENKDISFSVDFDTKKLLEALGITEEDSFENHQIRFKTLLNLIEKLQKENEELKQSLIINKKLYEEFEKEMFLQINEDEIDVTSAAALSNKLLQFCNGAIYKDGGKEYVEVHNSKIEALLELIEEAQRTTTINIL